jgi:hypothetical protein
MSEEKTKPVNDGQQLLSYPNVLIYEGTRFQFNPHSIIYSTPKITRHGGFVINIRYPLNGHLADGTPINETVPIMLQTPTMRTSFGMSTKEHEGKLRGTIDLTFYDDASPEVQAFKSVMVLWDRLLLKKAKAKREEWFKSNKVTAEILEYLYNPMVRGNKRKSDGKVFADSFRVKVPRRNEKFECEVYNKQKQPIPLDEVVRGSNCRLMARHTGIWFSDTMFVSSFDTPQVQLRGNTELTGFSFVGDDEEETSVTDENEYSMAE